ncbi:UDP-2,3-diacylglucosamine diphosphatase [Moraxella lincolnii]|uniref:UDP-2,3-diacylglucosamine diphosphatase n=1 Tax=Lwoffella lincolnii TaxID=90241 RepID=UPI0030D525F7
MTDPTFETFEHLITTCPHQLQAVFVSDLHLSADEPALMQAFLALLDDLLALPNLRQLYILGDWFDAWIGDDSYLQLSDDAKMTHWLTPMFMALKSLRIQGCDILVMHGNRDFLLGQPLCNVFAGQLVTEPQFIDLYELIDDEFVDKKNPITNQPSINHSNNHSNNHHTSDTSVHHRLRLEHGDALCTDDKAYQRLRRWSRNRLLQWWLLSKPLHKRQKIANLLRQKSQKSNHKKASHIMDVNAAAVDDVMVQVDMLLHGHTHRPAIHKLANHKYRFVLGDWQSDNTTQVSAVIGVLVSDKKNGLAKLRLVNFAHLLKYPST